MSWLQPQAGEITLPVPGPFSEPFWQGCREGALRYQKCLDCGAPTHTPAIMCSSCTSRSIEWVDSTGRGEIFSWTRVWRPVTPAFVTPYVPIIVTLDEDWTMLSNLVECEESDVTIGLRVEVVFHDAGGPDRISLPYFRPAS